jgi:YD repeat-containing protein
MKYDSLDRVREVRYPHAPGEGERTERVRYGMRDGIRTTRTTDPEGNAGVREEDGRGNVVAVIREDGNGDVLTRATYRYNGLGELEEARDAAGNPLTMAYDMTGRRVAMESADIGRKEWKYDRAGNLVEETDSVLAARGERIRYEYDGLNRLVKTDYPWSEDTVYVYGAPGAGDGGANRVTERRDEAGTVRYGYGKLGEVTEETRRGDGVIPFSSSLRKSGKRC